MFKTDYKDEFYLALRNALHAEVDSWRNSGCATSDADRTLLWEKVFALEQSSGNSEATSFATYETATRQAGTDHLVHLQVTQSGGSHG